jgi:hypothetical protein
MSEQKNFEKYLEIKKGVNTFAPAFREKQALKARQGEKELKHASGTGGPIFSYCCGVRERCEGNCGSLRWLIKTVD